jgi:hypothetical protein
MPEIAISAFDANGLASDLTGDQVALAFLATAYHQLTSSHQANTRLIEHLDLVTRLWFMDPSQGDLYQAFLQLAPVTGSYTAINDSTIAGIAEKLSGETGWARPILNQLYLLPVENNLEVWRDTLLPVWKTINTRALALDINGEIAKTLAFSCSADRWEKVQTYAAQLVDVLAGARTTAVEEHPLVAYRRQVLGPVIQNRRFSTGLKGLDLALRGGFASPLSDCGGRLIVVAARPAQGKTAFGVSLAVRCALFGRQVLYFSLEMGPKEMSNRALAAVDYQWCMELGKGTPATSDQLDSQTLDAEQRERLADFPMEAFSSNLLFHRGGIVINAKEVALQIRHAKQRNPEQFSTAFIDYLGLLDRDGQNTNDAIAEATRSLKATALTTGIDIVLLCQLNRGVEARADKTPQLADLRDSGAIEQDADMVIGLLRPYYYDPGEDPMKMIYAVIKNRSGKAGRYEATFIGESAVVLDR